MKQLRLIQLCLGSLTFLTLAGCFPQSNDNWDNKNIGLRYKNTLIDQRESLEEEFLPLNETDLKNQFSENSISYTHHDFGEQGIPQAEEFNEPKGALSTIFRPIFFETDKFNIKLPEVFELLHQAALYLKSHPQTYIIVEGHCDERGPEGYNLALGTKRANEVRALLLKENVNPDQIHTISYGKEKPFSKGHDPAAWAANRRAHFRIHSK